MKARSFLLCLAVLLAAPHLLPIFYVTLADYVGLASIVVLGLVLIGGAGGMMSFGQAAFAGIGAYTTAVLTVTYGQSPWVALLVGLVLTGVLALFLGLLTLPLSSAYLPFGTMAWSISLYYLFANIAALGRGSGIADIPPIRIFAHALTSNADFFYLIWGIVLAATVALLNLLASRSGRAIRIAGHSTLLAQALGIDSNRVRMAIFVQAALLAAISGWLYAHFLRFVNPTPFGLSASIDYFFMTVIGGAATVAGAVFGAAFVTIITPVLQSYVPMFLGQPGQFETVIYGILVLLLLRYAPRGLVPLFFSPRRNRSVLQADIAAPALPIKPQPAARDTVLELSGLQKNFGGLAAVNKLSFSVSAGEIVALIGPNGAGKTTSFNMIGGALRPSAGSIRICGRQVDGISPRRVARLRVARTFQHAMLRPSLSVIENVAAGAHLRGRRGMFAAALRLDGREERRLLGEARRQLERVGLGNLAGAAADTLALGQQRLVEVARALAGDPILLLLDEPAAGLRFEEKQALAGLFWQLRGDGVTLLLVEHDMDFVMGLVDRIVVMDFGEKIAEGRPEEIRNDPRVIEAYLGGIN